MRPKFTTIKLNLDSIDVIRSSHGKRGKLKHEVEWKSDATELNVIFIANVILCKPRIMSSCPYCFYFHWLKLLFYSH